MFTTCVEDPIQWVEWMFTTYIGLIIVRAESHIINVCTRLVLRTVLDSVLIGRPTAPPQLDNIKIS